MTRRQQLLDRLIHAPNDERALEAVVAFFAHRNEFRGLYEALAEVVESVGDAEDLQLLKQRLPGLLSLHLASAENQPLEAAIKLRLSRTLSRQETSRDQALVLAAEAFCSAPGGAIASEAIDIIRTTGQPLLLVQFLRRKALNEPDPGRQCDALAELAFAALSDNRVALALWVLSLLEERPNSRQYNSLERLRRAVDRQLCDLDEKKKQLRLRSIYADSDEERQEVARALGLIHARLGEYNEAIPLLEASARRSPSPELFLELKEIYQATGAWPRLVVLLDWWAQIAEAEVRKELLMERTRLLLEKLEQRESAIVAALEIWAEFTDDPESGEFCATVYGDARDFKGQADIYKRLCEEAQDPVRERKYLEHEALIRWQKLGQWEDAERIYRRLKATDPRCKPALYFYPEYYRHVGDDKRLFWALSTWLPFVEDHERESVLREMASLALADPETPDRAIATLRRLLTLAPQDRWAHEKLTGLLAGERRWYALINLYQECMSSPGNSLAQRAECLLKLADIYADPAKLNSPELAIATLKTLRQLQADHTQCNQMLAGLYRRTERWEELVQLQEQLLEALPTSHPSAASLRIEVARTRCLHSLATDESIQLLEETIQTTPEDTESLHALMVAHKDRGNLERLLIPGSALLELYLESLLDTPEADDSVPLPKTITLVFRNDASELGHAELEEAELVFDDHRHS